MLETMPQNRTIAGGCHPSKHHEYLAERCYFILINFGYLKEKNELF
jgi:hypothetical protein